MDGLDPLPFVLIRLLIGVAVLAVWMRARGEPFPRERPMLSRLATLGAVNVWGAFLLITWGQQYVSSSYAAILVATGPVFSSVGASLVLPDEGLDRSRALGVVLGFAGVAALFAGDLGNDSAHSTFDQVLGATAVIVGAVIVASVAIAVRLRIRDLTPAQIALPQLLAATVTVAVLMGIVALLGGSFRFDLWSPGVIVGLLALGIFNAGLGNIVYYRLILRWGVTRTALVGYTAPFVGAFVGATLLDERLGAAALVGLALITVSLVWVNRRGSELAARGSSGSVGAVTAGAAGTEGR